MSKHTPAPWWVEVDESANSGPYSFPIINSKDYEIVGIEGIYGDFETDMANARLIASAPELLEALKDLTERYKKVAGISSDGWINQSQKAIAKAEGL